MAKRRCFSVDLFEDEKFLNLNDKSKVLYFGLILHSDDEGVIINPTAVMRLLKKQKKYFDELIENGFVMRVDKMFVIKHWNLHNHIQPSKKTDSLYQNELSKLTINQSKEYELKTDIIKALGGFSADFRRTN